MNGRWVEPDIRDAVVAWVEQMARRSGLPKNRLLRWVGITEAKYYSWRGREGLPNCHNGSQPRTHWLRPAERQAIIDFCRPRMEHGYRRLTYMMLDQDICAVSPATTWRVLKSAGLMQRWATAKTTSKGRGFTQPTAVHEHRHIDISMVKIQGIHYNLISVPDGYSRKIVNHELRVKMEYDDIAIVLQQAAEFCPDATPRIISDNGGQFVARDFKELINHLTYTHVRTSPAYPQSNGKIERYHGTIKSEAIRQQSYLDLQDARQQIAGYITHYNTERLHSAISYLTPQDVVDGRTDEILNERDRKLRAARQRRRQAA